MVITMKNIYSILNEALVIVFNLVLKAEEKFIRSLGVNLSITEIHTLEAIASDVEKPMSEIASRLSITLGTLTTSINNLEKKGFVKRKRSEKDRRVVIVNLTEKAHDIMEKHTSFHENMVHEIVTELNKQEEYALMKALNNLIDYFTNKYGEE